MPRFISHSLLLVCGLLLAACGDSSTDDARLVAQSSPDGVLRVSVPAADLDGDLTIEASDATVSGLGTIVLAAFSAGPDGATFSEPGTITFAVSGVSERMALVVISISDTFGVEVLDATVELVGDQAMVTAPIEHFSSFVLAGIEHDIFLMPENWDMKKGEAEAVRLNIRSADGNMEGSIDAVGRFELSEIATTGALGETTDMTVTCVDVGPSTFRVSGTLAAQISFFDDETGITFPLEASVPVEEQGSVGCFGSPEDLVATDDPVPPKLESTDRRCVGADGEEKEADACAETELEAGAEELTLRLPDADGPYATSSINFTAGDGMLGLVCDGRDPATLQPQSPGATGPCRLLYFADGLSGTQVMIDPTLLPMFTLEDDGLSMSNGPLFDVDAGVAVMVIPDDAADVGDMPIAGGRYVIDSLAATMQPVGGDFSVVQVNVSGFGDFVTAARSGR